VSRVTTEQDRKSGRLRVGRSRGVATPPASSLCSPGPGAGTPACISPSLTGGPAGVGPHPIGV